MTPELALALPLTRRVIRLASQLYAARHPEARGDGAAADLARSLSPRVRLMPEAAGVDALALRFPPRRNTRRRAHLGLLFQRATCPPVYADALPAWW